MTVSVGLYGNGVYVVVIDTGVNYAQEAFMTPEGKTKIAVLWDQNTDTVYSEDEINAAILSENPYVPHEEGLAHLGRSYKETRQSKEMFI